MPRIRAAAAAWVRPIVLILEKVSPYPQALRWETKGGTDCFATAPSSYYDHNGQIRSSAFTQPHQNGYYSQQQSYGGPPLYFGHSINPRSYDLGHPAAYDSRKRGFEDLNEFFGNAKRRQVDPSSYAQIGRSLMPLQGALTVAGGGLATEYMAAPAPAVASVGGVSSVHDPLTQHYYLPPMSNLRTKLDLEQMDQILQQMQGTIYENSGSSAQAQFAAALDVRRVSPGTRAMGPNDHYAMSAAHMPSPPTDASTTHSDSPAVTPPSTTMSVSGHSPSASLSGMSPMSHPGSSVVSYPTLPATTGLTHPGSTTTSTLASNFHPVERRMSGGRLGQASGGGQHDDEDADGTNATAGAVSPSRSQSEDSESNSEPETYESWLENIRMIEFLRKYVHARLQKGDYAEQMIKSEESRASPMAVDEKDRSAFPVERPLYPTLRMVAD